MADEGTFRPWMQTQKHLCNSNQICGPTTMQSGWEYFDCDLIWHKIPCFKRATHGLRLGHTLETWKMPLLRFLNGHCLCFLLAYMACACAFRILISGMCQMVLVSLFNSFWHSKNQCTFCHTNGIARVGMDGGQRRYKWPGQYFVFLFVSIGAYAVLGGVDDYENLQI